MRTAILVVTAWAIGCAPTYTQHAKTPDDILAEQEALGAKQVKSEKESEDEVDVEDQMNTPDQQERFDERYTDLEIKRAVRSAETCPGVSDQGPYGEVKASVTFNNDGHVDADKSSVNAPFAGTANGECVLRALNAIITKNFVGQPVTKEISLTLSEPEKKPEKK